MPVFDLVGRFTPVNHPCPAFPAWQRAVWDRRWRACLSCYCLARCGCGRGPARPFLRSRCASCGASLREVLPAAFRERATSPSPGETSTH